MGLGTVRTSGVSLYLSTQRIEEEYHPLLSVYNCKLHLSFQIDVEIYLNERWGK